MELPHVNYLAVLVSGVVIFLLGGMWYSKLLFAKPWIALMGKSQEELRANAGPMPVNFLIAFLCGLISAYVIAAFLNHHEPATIARGAKLGAVCWLGFTATSSLATAVFSSIPKKLWLINAGYNLVSYVIAGMILAAWRW
jgi:surface polysaccharide O-acyltransferase-like enzyme